MGTATTSNRVEKLAKNKSNEKTTRVKSESRKPAEPNIYAQRVEKKAYELFEKRGCQNGHDWDDWFEAERVVEAEMIAVQ